MITVIVFGNGNMAWHLCNAFNYCKNVSVVQQYHHKKQDNKFKDFQIPFTNKLQHLKKADFYILAVSDDSIANLSAGLPVFEGIVLHTSGAVSIDALHKKNRNGVFYPLQTLSKGRKIDYTEIPICLEAQNEEDLTLIKELAGTITNNPYQINSEQRRTLHLAAVFANNFVNHLYEIAYTVCEKEGIDSSLLEALILETAKKAIDIMPANAQTGPAKRRDQETMKKHLKKLEGKQELIYKTISASILDTYGRKKL
jgi:predicted short-subunit dehydrogenase-like oxidoreductase (DUF2520 family)